MKNNERVNKNIKLKKFAKVLAAAEEVELKHYLIEELSNEEYTLDELESPKHWWEVLSIVYGFKYDLNDLDWSMIDTYAESYEDRREVFINHFGTANLYLNRFLIKNYVI